jgi:hypothetical protein
VSGGSAFGQPEWRSKPECPLTRLRGCGLQLRLRFQAEPQLTTWCRGDPRSALASHRSIVKRLISDNAIAYCKAKPAGLLEHSGIRQLLTRSADPKSGLVRRERAP